MLQIKNLDIIILRLPCEQRPVINAFYIVYLYVIRDR